MMARRRMSQAWVWVVIVAAACLASACGSTSREPADLVLRHGKIVTVEDALPEAQALAMRGDLIAAVGSDAEIEPYIGPGTRVIDLGGKLAIPGFIDSHAHFTGIGQAAMNLNLIRARDWDEITAHVEAAARKAKPGEWILGRGWHQEKWEKKPVPDVEGFPTHESLSRVSPANPVLLVHASGHASYANAKAMELAGITRATLDPHGGQIVKDSRGNPIGVLRETAAGLVGKALSASRARRTPEETEAEARREIELAEQECLAKGVTSLHDAGVSFQKVDLYRKLADSGKLGVRLYVMLSPGNAALAQEMARYRFVDYGSRHLTVRSIKRLIDGALGPRGAWLLEPYSDLPGSKGLNTSPVEEVAETARLAIENDFQMCVHAIGDRANREVLDIYEAAFRKYPDRKGLRWRIEHAQHIDPADIPRFGALGVVAAMQGIHCTSDAPYVLARLGAQRAEQGAYAWRSLLQAGVPISNGTDAPVEDVNPIESFHASVSRKLKSGSAFYAGQKMTRMEALASYTIQGAFAAFEENIKGSLKPGKLADIVVLSKDILAVPEDEIPSAEVLYTIIGGKVLHRRP